MNKKILSSILIILAILAIVSTFFIPKEIVESYGTFVYAVPFILVLVLVAIAIIISGQKKDNPLLINRQQALSAIKQAEKNFLQHKIDKETFDKISQENNSKLIQIEAKIDVEKNKGAPKSEMKKNSSISSDKRNIIKGLLDQKQIKVTELKKAENSFYHRKIDEDGFKKISSQIKGEIITIDSQIKGIVDSEEIENLKNQLKEGAKEITKQKKVTKERAKEDYFDEVEEDLIKQMGSN
jgi:hypothetical protein